MTPSCPGAIGEGSDMEHDQVDCLDLVNRQSNFTAFDRTESCYVNLVIIRRRFETLVESRRIYRHGWLVEPEFHGRRLAFRTADRQSP